MLFIHAQTLLKLNLWSCTLEHILAYLIVLKYFVIIKTLEELYKLILFQHTIGDLGSLESVLVMLLHYY